MFLSSITRSNITTGISRGILFFMSVASLQPFLVEISRWLALAAPYLAAGAFLLALLSLLLLLSLRRRFKRLALGKNGSIEESIAVLTREGKDIKEFRAELEKYLKLAESRLRTSVRGIGVVRFNPFQSGQGGNQSFAAAFIDEGGDGVVFSTLYARDRVGVYAKPLTAGASSFELSEEEKEAVRKAKGSIGHHKK
jgi:hypothetical protein